MQLLKLLRNKNKICCDVPSSAVEEALTAALERRSDEEDERPDQFVELLKGKIKPGADRVISEISCDNESDTADCISGGIGLEEAGIEIDHSVYCLVRIDIESINAPEDHTAKAEGQSHIHIHHLGVACAISPHYVITSRLAIHSLTGDPSTCRFGLIPKSFVGKRVSQDEVLLLNIVMESIVNNWIVLQRIDGNVFQSYAQLYEGEIELPKQFDRIMVNSFSVYAPNTNCVICYPEVHKTSLTRYLASELMEIQSTQRQQDMVMIHGSHLGAGKIGAPYFFHGKLIGFHVRGVDDISFYNDQLEKTYYSEGYVLNKLKDFQEWRLKAL